MVDEKTKRAITYSFLAQSRNTMVLHNGILDVFIPLVKKGMSSYCVKNKGNGGKNIDEIRDIIKEDYAIDMPHSVLRALMVKIEKEVGDPNLFRVYKDDGFFLKSYLFLEFDDALQQAKDDVKLIQEMYEQFCIVYEYDIHITPSVIDFIDNNRDVLSSYISNQAKPCDGDFTCAAQFVDFCRAIPQVYLLLCNQYLGSVITCFLEFKPQNVKMGIDLLLDTNFIISLLDLNTEASTQTCTKLFDLTKSLGYTHHVLRDTIEETQQLLYNKSKQIDNAIIYKYINKEDILSACERLNYNAADLDRIADNLEETLTKKGILIVYNTDYLTGKARYSSEYEILKSKRNTQKAALHDAKAIYYVKEKRGKVVASFEQSTCWFVNNTITHDGDRDSIDALLSSERKSGMPEIIKADDLLNILWLSNPQINVAIANDLLSDIGLTSLVSLTLNKSLPKQRIIRKLDENIQKYRTEDVSDRDVLMLSSRIVNHHLNSDEIESLNGKAQKDRREFSQRIKEEAAKEETLRKKQSARIDTLVTKWQFNIKDVLKGRFEIIKTVQDEKKSLLDANAAKDAEIKRQKELRLKQENAIRKEKRDNYIKKQLREWRKWPKFFIILFIFLLLIGLSWFVYSLFVTQNEEEQVWYSKLLESKSFSFLFTVMMGVVNYFVFKTYHDRMFFTSNINSFVDHLYIPEELRDLNSIDELDNIG